MNVFHRHKPKHLAHDCGFTARVLLGFLGAQALFLPVSTAAASEITKADGGSTAFNHFTKFSLSSGNIANLYFRENAAGYDVARLFNFVDGRIDIKGTVNALQNGSVGGQLFFLSPDGITVGATGVVNAGTINLLTPTSSAYDKLLGEGLDGDFTTLEENVTGNRYAVNPEATIEIAGQLHAVDGIKLRTANVKLGEDAVLRTGTATLAADGSVAGIADEIDFGSLVNIEQDDGTVINAGINGGVLKASTNANGDIVLSAIAASSATAPNADESWSDLEEGGYHPDIANPLGQVVFTKAYITLGGRITAKEAIDVEATSSNEYKSNNDTTTVKAWAQTTNNLR
ncbi:leukotoxin LktA family filamentous adhesin [Selenomonas sp.]|uniref:leukotoxin LktA family filamentous adhesin n=1 Tax=Selenomonas sp. TaxID=2053611 RepID=UPI002A7620E9|nr:leukotoxin LktA family filamentous adhesin [Selenomonas sp.]MDY3297041.1 leukotoxin LktA family filamentous adhesin [Selenomonas sp.]